jgi:hypothetical protein
VLRLLHISDIHFRAPYCLDAAHDTDGPIRDALIEDLDRFTEKSPEPISGILITGDIAFQADPEEYEIATSWLNELCERFSCPPQNVFVVPGNHDVNRSTCRDMMVNAVREQVLSRAGEYRERAFVDTLNHKDSGPLLIKPMEAYNKFAARYACDISPKKPFWSEELYIDKENGAKVILNGITTTFFSGEADAPGKLFLGNIQTNFRKKDGAIHLSMMHHPHDWFQNPDEIDDALNNGAAIQLLGHKHRGRWQPGDESVRISAEAFHPDKTEDACEPGYNIIDLSLTEDSSGDSVVMVTGHIRVLQNSPYIFRGKVTKGGKEEFKTQIPITLPTPVKSNTTEAEPTPEANDALTSDILVSDVLESETTPELSSREIVFRFWELKSSQRMKIFNDLELLSDDDFGLPETERFHIAFKNVKSNKKIESLIEQIEAMERINGQ